jgi:hypothetical protein
MTVSAHDPFRSMAVEVAGKYAEMSGGTPADVGSLTSALADRLTSVAANAPSGATIDLAFRRNGSGVEVTLSCGDERAVLRQPLLAKQE